MEVLEAIKKRRSIRKFDTAKKVSDEQIEKLLEAARWAPSAGNLQAWYFVIVQSSRIKEQLVEAAGGQEFIAQAPVVLVACADLKRSTSRYSTRGESLYAIQDVTIATQNLCLAATEMGLGVCWVGAFNEDDVSDALYLSGSLRPIVILPLGYPAESPEAPDRRPISQISRKV